jgi:hypothetical protein
MGTTPNIHLEIITPKSPRFKFHLSGRMENGRERKSS